MVKAAIKETGSAHEEEHRPIPAPPETSWKCARQFLVTDGCMKRRIFPHSLIHAPDSTDAWCLVIALSSAATIPGNTKDVKESVFSSFLETKRHRKFGWFEADVLTKLIFSMHRFVQVTFDQKILKIMWGRRYLEFLLSAWKVQLFHQLISLNVSMTSLLSAVYWYMCWYWNMIWYMHFIS